MHLIYDPILYHFWDKARSWSKITIFSYALSFNAPIIM